MQIAYPMNIILMNWSDSLYCPIDFLDLKLVVSDVRSATKKEQWKKMTQLIFDSAVKVVRLW